MEMVLAQKLLELSPIELAEMLKKLQREDFSAYALLKELIEDT
jgi:hypothetical protein